MKGIESMAPVPTRFPEWRMATNAPASSTIFMITPPCTLPSAFASCEPISALSVKREAEMRLRSRIVLACIRDQVGNTLKDFGVPFEYVDLAEAQFSVHGRQRRTR